MRSCRKPETTLPLPGSVLKGFIKINVTAPENDEREIELIEFTGDIITDILPDYGYHMLVMPTRQVAESV